MSTTASLFPSKYLNPKTDLVFKRIFGEHPKILMNFLNALLPLGPDRYITHLEYLSPELVPIEPTERNSVVDVRCKDNHGRQFIVEMQSYWNAAFMKRLLFNTSKAYISQLGPADDFNLLQSVYSLALLNSKKPNLPGDPVALPDTTPVEPDFFHHYQFINKSAPKDHLEGMELLLIELPRFRPEAWADRKLAVLWLRFLREIKEDTEDVDTELLSVPEIKEAVALCERTDYSNEQLLHYNQFLDVVRTQRGAESAKFDEGKAEERLAIARRLKAKGTPAADIADITGLTPSEIQKL
jgi:predicted transposase/invertase (TIGR01784 family)